MTAHSRWRLFLPCAAGVEALLCDEIGRLLPGAPLHARRGGVSLSSGAEGLMALNLGSRLAQRVLVEVASADYRHEDDLYAMALRVDWATWITPRFVSTPYTRQRPAVVRVVVRPGPVSPGTTSCGRDR